MRSAERRMRDAEWKNRNVYGAKLTPHSEHPPLANAGCGPRTPNSKGFTLIELMVVVIVLGVMVALVAPRLGELGAANLKRSARHLTGMIRFLRDEAQAKKTPYYLRFDIQDGRYWVEEFKILDDKSGEFKKVSQVIAGEGSLSGNTKFRDIIVPGHPDDPSLLFMPDGWVEHALIHLRDGSDRDFTLIVMPLTGKTELREGYVEER